MNAPTTSSRKNLHPGQHNAPASRGTGSSLTALQARQFQKFHVDRVHKLVWTGVLEPQPGPPKRSPHHQLSSIDIIEPLENKENRGTKDEVEKRPQQCLAPVITAMNAPCNSKA